MRRRKGWVAFMLVVAVAMLAVGFVGPVGAAKKGFKDLMGSNFGYVQKILVRLVKSDYAGLPADVLIIEQHAADLASLVPPEAVDNREMFLSLAFNLGTHAKNLRIVVETLLERQNKPAPSGPLDINYLRNTAAAHFGNLVTTCVACHNQFRRKVLN